MRALPPVQSVDEALRICAEAEKSNVDLISDDLGRVELLYGSVREHSPDVAKAFKRTAILQIIEKIQSEVRGWGRLSGMESAEVLMQRLPGLSRFAASGKIGNLRNEWQALKQSQGERLAALAEERKKIFFEFSHLLPSLPVHFEQDGTAVLKQNFDAPEHQEVLKAAVKAIDGYDIGNSGLYRTCETDLPRTFWEIRNDEGWKSFGLGEAAKKRSALDELFGQDRTALGTVSKLLHQAATTLPMEVRGLFFPSPPSGVLSSDNNNDKSTYFRLSERDGDIELEVNMFGKVDSVIIPATMEDKLGKKWRTNQGPRFNGDPGPRNFGQSYRLRLLIDREAASQGKLQAVPGTPIEASVEYRFCPVVAAPQKNNGSSP